MSRLNGPVAFIDDQIDDSGSAAFQLLNEIRSTGRPVAAAKELPSDPQEWFDHWEALAYVVIDWDLSPGSPGLTGGATLSAFNRQRLFDFIVALMSRIYCPVVIVSAEDVTSIQRQVAEHPALHTSNGTLDGRVMVFSKDLVMDHLDARVDEWVSTSAALSALTAWVREMDRARNELFIDLNAGAADWPVYIWRAAVHDQVDPAYELATGIATNLINRMRPITFEPSLTSAEPQDGSGAARRRVSQGRTTIPADRLSEGMVLPGDIFKLDGGPEHAVWINISPACHTVGRLLRTEADGSEVREPVNLHLLLGERLAWPSTEGALKDMLKGTTNSLTLHTVLDGHPYKFRFGSARIESWADVKSNRVARLLPPFVTRLQQLHAAYIQSEGLPNVTFELYAD